MLSVTYFGGKGLLQRFFFRTGYVYAEEIERAEELQEYVTQNKLSASDYKMLKKWGTERNIDDFTISRGKWLLFDISYNGKIMYGSREIPNLTWRMYHRISFKDGTADVYIYEGTADKYFNILMVFSVVLGVAVCIGIVVSGMYENVKYIQCLMKEVNIISRGNLQGNVTVQGTDEIAQLASGLEHMRQTLVKKEQIEYDLKSAQEKLVLGMSHDLRTPLTGLMAYLEILKKQQKEGADTEHEWQKFAQRTGLSQQAGTPPKKKNVSWRRFFLYAAVVVVVAFVGWQANAYYSGISSSVELVTLETEVGQQARTVLPDGSTVLLNACSKLTYSLGEWRKARGVQLEGEAIFDVKHKNGKPFYVHTRHYDIRVLGTNFNVSSYAEEAEDIVTLKNGKVEIDVEGIVENAVLVPGESFVYDNRSGTYKIEKRSLNQIYAWEHKEIVFEGHTLENKKEELSRHFGYRFQIAPELHQLSFKATLRDESLNEFLSLLCSITPQLSYRIDATHKVVELVKLEE